MRKGRLEPGIDRFVTERARLVVSASPGATAAAALSDLTDEAVRELARAASSRLAGRWALIALGGWGAGALLPDSDLDLLVLSDQPETRLKPFVEAVLYPLWDAGLDVGHQVRSSGQQRAAMRADLRTCTAALTARVVAGDVGWGDAAIATWLADCRKRSTALLRAISDRPRSGSPYLLEPDLKDGTGGRRDYDELTWRAGVLTGRRVADCAPLVELALLTTEEYATVRAHAETVCAARWELQRAGSGDRMTIEWADEPTAVEPEAVQEAIAETAGLLERVRAGGTARAFSAEPIPAAEVFDLLDAGAAADLERAAQAGRLEHLLPGMRDLMHARRPGLGHELTVGAHCIAAASLVATVRADGPLGRSLASLADRRVAQAAALAHDAGKAHGGAGHAERGAPLARDAAVRLGLGAGCARDVGEIVALHLVLVETALRDDLDDEDAVLRCAARVARQELVAPLHVLTAVDAMATGRSTWTPWLDSLVGSLVTRLDSALSDEVDGAGLAAAGERSRSAALDALPAAASAERAFVESASLRYLACRTAERVVRDARLVASLSRSAGTTAHLAVSAGPAENTSTLTIAAVDAPHTLARLSGALSLAGLDILSVGAYAAPAGIVLDEFVVASATGRPVTEATFWEVERLVTTALRDRLELAARLSERRRYYPPRAIAATSVRTEVIGWTTAVHVTAADRPGLLHDIATAITADGLDIRWAKAITIDGVAHDTFHISGSDPGPVTDPGVLGHLAMRIRAI